jgi:MFS superfamily sulfate permease-like transporter
VSENSIRSSGRTFVFMDQPTQTGVSTYPNPMISNLPRPGIPSVLDCEWSTRSLGFRDLLGQPLVGAVSVVVTSEAAKDLLEMPFVHDQEVVEAL